MSDELEFTIRSHTKADVPGMLLLDTGKSRLLNEREFNRCLKKKNVAAFVMASDTKVVGCLIVEIFKEFFQVINIVIQPSLRRRDLGTQLLEFLAEQINPAKRKKIVVEVRERNLDLQLFLKACKYRATEVIRNHFKDTNEDCYKMEFKQSWPIKTKLERKVAVG